MKKELKIKIFVAHHKPGYIYEDDIYVPIQVGKKSSKIDLGILGDDTGDNISEKNSNYAELTAQYWVWKNYDLSDVDYVGFCHYRRYMTYCYKPNIFNYIFAKNFYSPSEKINKHSWKLHALKKHNCLMKYSKNTLKYNSIKIKDFIKSNQVDVYTVKNNIYIKGKILSILGIKHPTTIHLYNAIGENKLSFEYEKLFSNLYPNIYASKKEIEDELIDSYGLNKHMFIMKKNLFIEYASFLFNFLFSFEKMIKNKDIDIGLYGWGKDSRFIAITSESLINYWLLYKKRINNIKILSEGNLLTFTDYYI